MPRTVFLVVCGTGDTIDTLAPQRAFKSVDLPDEGLPTMAAKADFAIMLSYGARRVLPGGFASMREEFGSLLLKVSPQ